MHIKILPLDPSMHHYGGYVEAMGRQYRVSLTCPGGPNTAVDVSSFQCDQELSRLLHARGVGKTLRARLAQASDVNGFMAELTDVLEKVLRACPAQEPPPAEFYARLVAEMDEVGWTHLVSMDSLLTSITLREYDSSDARAVGYPRDGRYHVPLRLCTDGDINIPCATKYPHPSVIYTLASLKRRDYLPPLARNSL